MESTHPCVSTHLRRGVLAGGLVVLLVLALAPVASATRSGRIAPESHWSPWAPGKAADCALREGYVQHGIWDAQPTGALVYTRTEVTPEMTLTATDATGTAVWSVETGDVSAATGTLPAAFVAVFANPDSNVLRSGELRAYNADGTVGFHKTFADKFVQPLCDTPTRLVWAEVSAQKVTRVFVRQRSVTRSIALPYRPPKAFFTNPAASSADGSHLAIGVYMNDPNRWRMMLYWLRVSRAGVPSIVSHRVTDWSYLALSPDGSKAAVMPPESSPNLWVGFGKFAGRPLPAQGLLEIGVGSRRIFAQGGYNYESESAAWSSSTVTVLDWALSPEYQRTWVWDNVTSGIWFRHDAGIRYLAGIDHTGALTAIDVDTYAIAAVPGIFADAVPLGDGTLVTVTPAGVLGFIPNPVPAL
jgi:hypothetical protein